MSVGPSVESTAFPGSFTLQLHDVGGAETYGLQPAVMIHRTRTESHRPPSIRRPRHSLVRRVREILRAQIVHACFRDGVLPGEFQLVKQYGVSRGVIREVLALLRAEGLIDRMQGAGTFVVAQERSPFGIHTARSLGEGLAPEESRVSWELLNAGRFPAPPLVADRLELTGAKDPEDPEDVVFVERLTELDGHPLMVRSSWFPLAVATPLLDPGFEFRSSIYDLIEGVLGHEVAYARLRVEATQADPATAPALDVEVGAPVQLMERVVYGVDGRPLECSFARARGDRFVLTTVMPRRQATGLAEPPAACREGSTT
jgi:GntR family transcriptional regulator